jgi:S-disulfanyl-L-cysteine oxidoreductase SoxD
MKTSGSILFLALGLMGGTGSAQTSPATTSVRSGVYTAPQSQAGKQIYDAKCGMCHGAKLEGAGPNPALAGNGFLERWSGRSVEDLFAKTITMMPAMQPGSLSPAETAQILAYVFSADGFPPGQNELSDDVRKLALITIQK